MFGMVNALKFRTLKFLKKCHMQTVGADQTASWGAVWPGSTLFAIPLSILRNNILKAKFLPKKNGIKCSNFRTFTTLQIDFFSSTTKVTETLSFCYMHRSRPACVCGCDHPTHICIGQSGSSCVLYTVQCPCNCINIQRFVANNSGIFFSYISIRTYAVG